MKMEVSDLEVVSPNPLLTTMETYDLLQLRPTAQAVTDARWNVIFLAESGNCGAIARIIMNMNNYALKYKTPWNFNSSRISLCGSLFELLGSGERP